MPRTKYTRVCIGCGDTATVGYRPKGTEMCRLCRGREQAKDMCGKNVKQEHEKKRYTHFCMMCPSVRVAVDGRKSNLCQSCSRKNARKTVPYIYFDFEEMKMKVPKRYFAICPDCPEEIATREVTQSMFSQRGTIVRCRKCAAKAKVGAKYKKTSTQVIKQARPKPKKVSKEAIEKEIAKNREHKIAQATPKLITQTLSDDDMMSAWLSDNEVKLVGDLRDISEVHISYGRLGSD